jgi:hypothetical protein
MPDSSRSALLAAAARRFIILFAVAASGTAVVSALIGLLLGANISRAVSLGFYGVGSFLLIGGFFAGNRGITRAKGDPGFAFFGIFRNREIRLASGEEQKESVNLSVIFVALGVLLIVLGVIADTRYRLV